MRRAGILLHPSSLPGEGPCGDLGDTAYHFLDWLEQSGITLWQTLPLHPPGGGFSPYSSPSAFAGAVYLISLEHLVQDGLLKESEIQNQPHAERMHEDGILHWKLPLIKKAAKKLLKTERSLCTKFGKENDWLGDWALFSALRTHHNVDGWQGFPEPLRNLDKTAIKKAKKEHANAIAIEEACQYLFFKQWYALKTEANRRGIMILGDMPIFVAADGADAWINRSLFHWDQWGNPSPVSGAPPDAFSAVGQHWGNPLYNWEEHQRTDFSWWIRRFEAEAKLADMIRIDHFRGFCAAWAIPTSANRDARLGSWTPALGDELFAKTKEHFGQLPFFAEDLGVITEDVHLLRYKYGLMGMKILQFAFESYTHAYLPHNYSDANWVCYTGTHDNDTAKGWYESAPSEYQHRYRMYVGRDGSDPAWDLIRLAWASVAQWSITTMQDVMVLGSEGRMNIPGQDSGHWSWRMSHIPWDSMERLRTMTECYGRLGRD